MPWTRDQMAHRASQEIQPGMVVNLGIGIPTLVANHLSSESGVMLHSENGLLGMGPFPYEGEEDPQIINAGFFLLLLRPFDTAGLACPPPTPTPPFCPSNSI